MKEEEIEKEVKEVVAPANTIIESGEDISITNDGTNEDVDNRPNHGIGTTGPKREDPNINTDINNG